MARAATQYCKEVNKQLACPGSLKRPFLRQLQAETVCFCEDHNNADLQALCSRFGSPEEVAEEFLAELRERTVERCVNRRKKVLLVTLAIIVAAIIAVGTLGMQNQHLQQKLTDEEFVASITYDEDSGRRFWFPFQDTIFGHNENLKE